jgi:hypothetical protein
VQSGLPAHEATLDPINSEQDDAFERLINMQPLTLDGFRAKASALVHYGWTGKIKDRETVIADSMMAAIISNLTGIPVTPWEESDDA